MLLVPVALNRSPLHGLGLFTVGPVARGTPIWAFEPGFDRVFTLREFEHLPAPAQAHLRHFGYLDGGAGVWVLGGDLSIFMNHSPDPTTGAPDSSGPARATVALRDLAAGEELTCDYRAFDAAPKPVP